MNSSSQTLKLMLLMACMVPCAFAQKTAVVDLAGTYSAMEDGRPSELSTVTIAKTVTGYTMEVSIKFSTKTNKYTFAPVPEKELESVGQAWFGKSASAIDLSCFYQEDMILCKIDPKAVLLEDKYGKNTGLFSAGAGYFPKISGLVWLISKN